MSTTRRATQAHIVSPPRDTAGTEPGITGAEHRLRRPHGISQPTIAAACILLLLLLATTSQGAFAISRWAPLTLFALAVLIGSLIARGGLALRSRAIGIALGAIWGLAAWSTLSMLWAQSSGDAFTAANRVVLYATIATLPFALPLSRRSLAATGWSLTAGIGAIAVYVLVRLLVDGSPLFLAGRLNGPVDYRNATALLFALPVWPFVVAAAGRGYRRGVRAASLSLAALCLGLVFLTQSRGILIGLVAGGCLALALGPDRVRRAWIGVLVLAGVAAASPWLLRPFHTFDGGDGYVGPHAIAVAAWALAALTAAAFAVGMMIALFDAGLRVGSPQMRHARRAARLALAGGTVVAVLAAGVAIGNPIAYLHGKWNQFTSLSFSTPTTTRLLTVGGQRYDLWRVAVREVESAPLLGVGAENYSFGYYRHRATNRNLNDPHSLVFALLSENGVIGIMLFASFLGGLAATMRGGWRELRPADRRHAVAMAATGAVLLGQSTVDWIWLIPGLTAIGVYSLSAAAALVAAGEELPARASAAQSAARDEFQTRVRPAGRRRLAPATLVRGAVVGALLGTVLCVMALFLSDSYIQRARSTVGDPRAELSSAQTAAIFDPWSVTPHYLEASAYETMGNRSSAYRQLQKALALEPANSATLGVLGDFEARGGNFAAARGYYRRALALDPLDTGLQQLALIGERR
jgi:hypothetical protein